MRGLLKRTVRTAMAMELVDLAVQAVDGTKVAANASSCRSYDAKGLAKLLERLDRAIAGLEDQNEGETGRAPVHLPEKLAGKRNLRDQVRRAMEELGDRKSQKSINLTDQDADGPGRPVHENEAGLLSRLPCSGHGFTSKERRGNLRHAGNGR